MTSGYVLAGYGLVFGLTGRLRPARGAAGAQARPAAARPRTSRGPEPATVTEPAGPAPRARPKRAAGAGPGPSCSAWCSPPPPSSCSRACRTPPCTSATPTRSASEPTACRASASASRARSCRGSVQRVAAPTSTSTITYKRRHHPGRTTSGEPGGIFKEGMPVVVEGRMGTRRDLRRRPLLVKHTETVPGGQANPGPASHDGGRRERRPRHRRGEPSASAGRCSASSPSSPASCAGSPTSAHGPRLRLASCSSARCSPSRRWSARSSPATSRSPTWPRSAPSHAAAVQLRRPVERARGLDPAVGARARRLHRPPSRSTSAAGSTTRSSAGPS